MADDTLFAFAQELLDSAAAILGATAPDRRLITPSDPAFDCCPFLAVSPGQLVKTPPASVSPLSGYESAVVPRMNGFDLVVWVVRCSPYLDAGQEPPTALAVTATAAATFQDCWVLWQGLQAAVRSGSLFAELGCKATGIGPATPVPDEGGCVGWQLVVSIIPEAAP